MRSATTGTVDGENEASAAIEAEIAAAVTIAATETEAAAKVGGAAAVSNSSNKVKMNGAMAANATPGAAATISNANNGASAKTTARLPAARSSALGPVAAVMKRGAMRAANSSSNKRNSSARC